MNTHQILLAILLASLFTPALAEGEEAGQQIEKRVVMMHGEAAGPMAGAQTFEAASFTGPLMRGRNKIVKNAPYSAEVVSERVQNLADGNQIVNKSSSMSYRDGAGRTRQEMKDNKGDVRVITINDADGNTFILHPQDKTATKIARREIGRAAGQAARAQVAQLRKEGKLGVVETKGPDGENIIVKRVEGLNGEQRKEIQENVRLRLTLGGPNGAALGPVIASAFSDMKWASKAATRELGTREFDGVKAHGKIRSYEIPAGEVGNRNPITVSDETWYSPDLQVTVYSKHSDPRSGERIFRLANLKREEPAAALFAVPSDYTVKEPMTQVNKSLAEKK